MVYMVLLIMEYLIACHRFEMKAKTDVNTTAMANANMGEFRDSVFELQ